MQTDLIGEKIEDGGLRLVSAFLNPPYAREEFECHFSCSPFAEELGRHFLLKNLMFFLRRWVQPPFRLRKIVTQNFFFHGQKFLTKKKIFFWGYTDIFPQVRKPSTEISRENKNCGFPQKCGRLEALNSAKTRSSLAGPLPNASWKPCPILPGCLNQ